MLQCIWDAHCIWLCLGVIERGRVSCFYVSQRVVFGSVHLAAGLDALRDTPHILPDIKILLCQHRPK